VFSPAGNTVALVLNDRVTLRDLADGREASSWEGQGWAFSPDGALAAISDRDPYQGLSVLDVAGKRVVRTMQVPGAAASFHPASVRSLAFSADGRRLLLCDSPGDVSVWDVGDGKLLHRHTGLAGKGFAAPAFSPDGSRLAAVSIANQEVTLWDTTTAQQVFAFPAASRVHPESTAALAWSGDGSTLAAADRLWNAAPRSEAGQAARRAAWADYALGWHRRAARDCEREGRWFAASFHLSRVLDASPADGSLWLRRGLADAQAERWAEAADALGRAIALDRIETFETRYQHALLLRRKGDLPGYRKAVAFLLERWGDAGDARVTRRVLQAALLDGEKAADRRRVEHLVQVTLSGKEEVVAVPGTMKARTYEQLRRLLNRTDLKPESLMGCVWPYAPLICERLGDRYESAFWLAQASRQIAVDRHEIVERMEGRLVRPHGEEVGWEDVLALDLLRQEIDALRKKTGN
jgi:hypothetical protein